MAEFFILQLCKILINSDLPFVAVPNFGFMFSLHLYSHLILGQLISSNATSYHDHYFNLNNACYRHRVPSMFQNMFSLFQTYLVSS